MVSFIASLAFTALAATCVTCSEFHARASTVDADFKLYAYSLSSSRGDLQGLPVFYGDGIAYAGFSAPAGVDTTYNVTVSATTEDSSFTATADNGTFSSTEWFYIDTSVADFGEVGFTTASNTTQNITGFGLYGAWVFHLGDSNDVQMNWYVEETDSTGVWQLKWNNVGTPVTSGVPIALRTQAPVKGNSKS